MSLKAQRSQRMKSRKAMKVDVSNGELVDKITILAIKLSKFKSAEKRRNVQKEYDLLHPLMDTIGISEESEEFKELLAVNLSLWEIEDRLRVKEASREFDDGFIRLARDVYFQNDRRSRIKRRINEISGSALIEEKEYVDYS